MASSRQPPRGLQLSYRYESGYGKWNVAAGSRSDLLTMIFISPSSVAISIVNPMNPLEK